MVKNESDIIEHFVRHNINFFNGMIVVDNGSSDGSLKILKDLERELDGLIVVSDPMPGYYQAEKMTLLFRKCVGIFKPDAVFFLDADEFIRGSTRKSLESELLKYEPGTVVYFPWQTYVPYANQDLGRGSCQAAAPLALEYRRMTEDPLYYKAAFVTNGASDMHIVVEQGNHSIHHEKGRRLNHVLCTDFRIVHYPVRSISQITTKVITGWHAYLIKNPGAAQSGQGYHWEELYRKALADEIDESSILRVAIGYAQKDSSTQGIHECIIYDRFETMSRVCEYTAELNTPPISKIALNTENIIKSLTGSSSFSNLITSMRASIDISALLDLVSLSGGGGDKIFFVDYAHSKVRKALENEDLISEAPVEECDICCIQIQCTSNLALAENAINNSSKASLLVMLPTVGLNPKEAERIAHYAAKRFLLAGWVANAELTRRARFISEIASLRAGMTVFTRYLDREGAIESLLSVFSNTLDTYRPVPGSSHEVITHIMVSTERLKALFTPQRMNT